MSPGLDERLRVYPRVAAVVAALCLAGWWWAGTGWLDPNGTPIGGDFASLYSAGRVAREGHAADAWDLTQLHYVVRDVLGTEHVARFPFHYAPPLLLVLAPLSAVPYAVALAVWLVAGLAAYTLPLALLRTDAREAGWVAASPAVLEGVLHGQTGGFVAGLLGGGLLLVERSPWLAGALLGGLLFKPQYLLVPLVVLGAGRHTRALAAFGLSILAQCLAVSWLLGPSAWGAFAMNVPFARRILLEGGVPWWKLTTVTAAALQLGASPVVAQVAQGIVAVGALAVATWMWVAAEERRGVAAALTAALLVTPFAFGYDWMLLAPALIVAARGARGAGAWTAIVAAWLAPVAHQGLAALGVPLWGPVSLAALTVVLIRGRRAR
jgi:hypothetical protein